MNVFCFPGVISGRIAELLAVPAGTCPAFGVPGSVPLEDGSCDATELDMQLGAVNFEAKLTENDFTHRRVEHVERYADLYDVFAEEALPRDRDIYLGYQLIGNVLAIARHPTTRFCVLLDARRPDLLREWWTVLGAIRSAEIRQRCGFVFWQEIAAAAPARLHDFLVSKYGL